MERVGIQGPPAADRGGANDASRDSARVAVGLTACSQGGTLFDEAGSSHIVINVSDFLYIRQPEP